MICAMLAESWERLRGYDKWPTTKAIVSSSDPEAVDWRPYQDPLSDVLFGPARPLKVDESSGYFFFWNDASGKPHKSRYFYVLSGSPLFQLIDGEVITIRYNPANPDEFYFRLLFESKLRTIRKWIVMFLIIGIAASGVILYIMSGGDNSQ